MPTVPLRGRDCSPSPEGAQRRSASPDVIGGKCMHDDEEFLRIPITDVFDLHTVQPREVAAVVEAYLDEAVGLGLETVRIIHGRGMGVQRRITQSRAQNHPRRHGRVLCFRRAAR
ncbi:MAG TPA: Smr/MutS family protein [Terriglobia bacterium]|nr:Smr/MutS family protein [Terriglobia bacterium]